MSTAARAESPLQCPFRLGPPTPRPYKRTMPTRAEPRASGSPFTVIPDRSGIIPPNPTGRITTLLGKSRMRALQLAIFGVATFATVGCASKLFTGISRDYPEHWTPVAASADPEQAIVGVYSNFGESSFNPMGTRDLPEPSLALVLADAPITFSRDARSTIRIARPQPGRLEIQVVGEGHAKFSRVFEMSKDDYRVSEGGIWFKPRKKSYGDGTGYVWENDSLGFKKSADGALICEWRHGSAALAMWIVPLKGSQVFWMRWQPSNRQR